MRSMPEFILCRIDRSSTKTKEEFELNESIYFTQMHIINSKERMRRFVGTLKCILYYKLLEGLAASCGFLSERDILRLQTCVYGGHIGLGSISGLSSSHFMQSTKCYWFEKEKPIVILGLLAQVHGV